MTMNQEYIFLENVLKEYKDGSSLLASSMLMSKYDTIDGAALAFAQMSIISIINDNIIPYFSKRNLLTQASSNTFSPPHNNISCYFPTECSLTVYEEQQDVLVPLTIQILPKFVLAINVTTTKSKILEVYCDALCSWDKVFSKAFSKIPNTEELISIIFNSVYNQCIKSLYSSDGTLKENIKVTINDFLTVTCDSNYYELEETML